MTAARALARLALPAAVRTPLTARRHVDLARVASAICLG